MESPPINTDEEWAGFFSGAASLLQPLEKQMKLTGRRDEEIEDISES
jgi:hypothetical protein